MAECKLIDSHAFVFLVGESPPILRILLQCESNSRKQLLDAAGTIEKVRCGGGRGVEPESSAPNGGRAPKKKHLCGSAETRERQRPT
jgi:hypothetical protein